MTERVPAEAFRPGEFLRDELDARGWTQLEFAEIIGRPVRVVNEIISGKRGISPETAKELAAALGTSAQYWMNLDAYYQLWKTAPAPERISHAAKLREAYPVKEMIKRGWIETSENMEVLETRVLGFFGIDAVDDKPQFYAATRRRNYDENFSPIQLAWLFRVKQLAEAIASNKFLPGDLRKALPQLRPLMAAPEEARHVPHILGACGVRFVVVEPMPGSKLDGVCFWLDAGKQPVIGMTLRLDRIDNFWFVLRHEIEHVLRGDGKMSPIIDDDILGPTSSDKPPEEVRADEAAAEFCIPQDRLDSFFVRKHPYFSERDVIAFALRTGVHPGIVVGQIQKRTDRWNFLHKHQVKIRQHIVPYAMADGWGDVMPV